MAYLPVHLNSWIKTVPTADGKFKWAKILMKDQKFNGGDTLAVIWEDWNDPEAVVHTVFANSDNYNPETNTLPCGEFTLDLTKIESEKSTSKDTKVEETTEQDEPEEEIEEEIEDGDESLEE